MTWLVGYFKPRKNAAYAYFQVLGISTAKEAVGFFHQENGTTQASWLKNDAHMDHEYVGTEKPKMAVKKMKEVWVLPDGSVTDKEEKGAVRGTVSWPGQA